MKSSIRRGVFETNSSSTHSIMYCRNPDTVASTGNWTKEEIYEQLKAIGVIFKKTSRWDESYELDFTQVNPELYQFNRTEEAYNTGAMKLLYALASFYGDEFLWPALLMSLNKDLNVYSIILPQIHNCKYLRDGPESFGCIDHESVGTLSEIFSAGISFSEYVFRKDIYLMIDNEG